MVIAFRKTCADVSLCNLLHRYPVEAFRKRQDFGQNKCRLGKQQR